MEEKRNAKEIATAALAAAPLDTPIHAECIEQLEKLSKRRWFF